MYKYRCIIHAQRGPSGGDPFCLLANFFLFFCRNSAVFIFPMLLADFKEQIPKQDRVSILWVDLHMAYAPLFFCINSSFWKISLFINASLLHIVTILYVKAVQFLFVSLFLFQIQTITYHINIQRTSYW